MKEQIVNIGPSVCPVQEYGGMIDNSTCKQLYEIVSGAALNSTTTTGDNGFRTSKTIHLDGRLPIVMAMNKKFANLCQVDEKCGEPLQGAFYETGAEFKLHTDYFEDFEVEKYCKEQGQRLWSVVAYLNDSEGGGEREFPQYKKKFVPKKGKILIWKNINDEGKPLPETIHCDLPVTQGSNAVLFKWFRERPI